MKQHPVPQDIITYKFRLVGDMTIKQFAELASGILLAWLIFNSHLYILFKWLLAPLVAFFGFALAFIPVEDRPLDKWIVNFLKAIYKPTQFVYQPQSKILSIFQSSATATTSPVRQPIEPQMLEKYLNTLPPTPASAFDSAEQKYLEHISNLFGALGSPITTTNSPSFSRPLPLKSSGVRVRQLSHPQFCLLPHAPHQPLVEPQAAAMPAVLPTSQPSSTPTAKTIKKAPSPPSPTKTPFPSQPSSTPAAKAVFAPDIVFPQKPEKPNLIAGITLDQKNKIVPNVIIEIKDSKNQPVRALKSNKLGQFYIATPLSDGIYRLAAEHPQHHFDIIKLEAKGEILPPLKIQSHD